MNKFTKFRWNEPNHGYYGLILIAVGFWNPFDWSMWFPISCYSFGGFLVIDEITQLWFGQHNGLVHWLYINTLYRIKWWAKLDTKINKSLRGDSDEEV